MIVCIDNFRQKKTIEFYIYYFFRSFWHWALFDSSPFYSCTVGTVFFALANISCLVAENCFDKFQLLKLWRLTFVTLVHWSCECMCIYVCSHLPCHPFRVWSTHVGYKLWSEVCFRHRRRNGLEIVPQKWNVDRYRYPTLVMCLQNLAFLKLWREGGMSRN